MQYQEEKIADILTELAPILEMHWEELANNKEVRMLNVAYDTYIKLNELGLIRIFTARDDYNLLVGYFCFCIAPNLHYQHWLHADVDVYYIHPEYRTGGVGSEMVGKVEEWLKSLGVNMVSMMDKIHHSHEKFFTRLGYKQVERIYEKIL